jgi:hypothetical protein
VIIIELVCERRGKGDADGEARGYMIYIFVVRMRAMMILGLRLLDALVASRPCENAAEMPSQAGAC